MKKLKNYFILWGQSFLGSFKTGSGAWESLVVMVLCFLTIFLFGLWEELWKDWMDLASTLILKGGEALFLQVVKMMVGMTLVLSIPFLLTGVYQFFYPEGEIFLLRSLPIAPFWLFMMRFLPCFGLVSFVMALVFFLAGAAYWQTGHREAAGWLALGWFSLSLLASSFIILIAILLGRLKSARFARLFSEGILFLAVIGLTGAFFYLSFYATREGVLEFLSRESLDLDLLLKALSLYVVPEGGRGAYSLLIGGLVSLLFLWRVARLDHYALDRGWGTPWSPRRTAIKTTKSLPKLPWLSPQARGLLIKELPVIRQSLPAFVMLILFVMVSYLFLDNIDNFSEKLYNFPLKKKIKPIGISYWFFLFVIPLVTVLMSTNEEKKALPLLRSLPLNLSKILWLKFWTHWIPISCCCILLSVFLAGYGFVSPLEALLIGGVSLPIAGAYVMWALLIGGWFRPFVKELDFLPMMIYITISTGPAFLTLKTMDFLEVPWNLLNLGILMGSLFILWVLPLPLLWKWVIRRWEEGM